MKSYLIEAQAPLAGCVEYYAAYAEDDSFEMTDEWLDTEREICEDLWLEIGKEICLKKIEDKVWFLLGYALQEKLYQKANNE
jgi:hypothetical protein